MKDISVAIIDQLRNLADEDDQLGRGEFKLLLVEEGTGDCEFFVIASEIGSDTPRKFIISIEEY